MRHVFLVGGVANLRHEMSGGSVRSAGTVFQEFEEGVECLRYPVSVADNVSKIARSAHHPYRLRSG